MALSTFQIRNGVEWPLGFVAVAANGTPVNIMSRVDANNVQAPGTVTGANSAEYTPHCHKIALQGFKPSANNNGMEPNSGNVYVLRALGPGNGNSGGPQNRTDSGAMVFILPPGGYATLPADEIDRAPISPYNYTIDSDVNGDGALITLLGVSS